MKKNSRNQMLLTDLYPLRKRSLVPLGSSAVQKENEQHYLCVRSFSECFLYVLLRYRTAVGEVQVQKSPSQKRGRQDE